MTEDTGDNAKKYTYIGESLPLSEWAKRKGMTYSSLWKRVEVKGIPLEQAMETPVRGEHNMLTFEGRTMPLSEWAEERGMSLDTLWKRIVESGWSVEKALFTPVRHYIRKSKTA